VSTIAAVVETAYGKIRGSENDGIHSFLGLPFAAPPFGALRMQPPQLPERWDGVREALEYGPTVPKSQYVPPFDRLLRDPEIAGDDCLNLNVWTPDPAASGLPVLVWIHGGAFTNGTGAIRTYAGDAFARDGVVAVTINYRLGADGFLAPGDGIANCGLLDQVAALEWVRDNIASFGGDPANVTIAGESAGAASVYALLALPVADGLFSQAVAQSGGPTVNSAGLGRKIAEWLAGRLGTEPTREALAGVPIPDLLAAQVELAGEMRTGRADRSFWGDERPVLAFAPIVDGDVLPDPPARRIAEGASTDVPLLAGSNSDEERLFLAPAGLVERMDDAALLASADRFGIDADFVGSYRAGRPDAKPGAVLAALGTDLRFWLPMLGVAESRFAASAPTYLYEFSWRSPLMDGALGACHALEIPFVFDTLDVRHALVGDEPPQELADAMHAAWVAFASSGEPGWPAYEASRRATMRFDVESEVVDDPRREDRLLWSGATG
jgi:para-nitrobenzyl esterase